MKRTLQIVGLLCGVAGTAMLVRLAVRFPGYLAEILDADTFVLAALALILEVFFATYPIITAVLLWRRFTKYAVYRLFVAVCICLVYAWPGVLPRLAAACFDRPWLAATCLTVIFVLYFLLPPLLFRIAQPPDDDAAQHGAC